MVAVDTTTVASSLIACTAAGTRYASDLPVPVPAWTARCSPVSIAVWTARAIATWPGRSAPPIPATAIASRPAISAAVPGGTGDADGTGAPGALVHNENCTSR